MKTRSQLNNDKRITTSMNKTPYSQLLSTTKHTNKNKNKKLNVKDTTTRHHRRSLDEFPDEILCRILSFFPTKPAVRTSVLSKRWRYMWTSLPNLDFQERTYSNYPDIIDREAERNKFIAFVERVLCRRNAPHIKRFLLSINVNDDAPRIIKWISTAVRRHALEFDISLYVRPNNLEYVPHYLFNSQTLQVLKLHIDSNLQLPSLISLPNLKILMLKCDFFGDYHELNLLLATSSSLEELVIEASNRYYAPAGLLIIPLPTLVPNLKILMLKGVFLRNYHSLNLSFAGSALEELGLEYCTWEGDESEGHLIISAPNLRSVTINDSFADWNDGLAYVSISSPLKIFNYRGGLNKDYRLTCSSSMENSSFLFDGRFIINEVDIPRDHFHNILSSLRFVKCLKLLAYALPELSEARLPVFNNLISLEIFKKLYGRNYNEGLEKILEKCPCLETLIVPGVFLAGYNTNRLLSSKLKCLSSLENITIECFEGDTEQLVAVHILLAKAISLETMEINRSSDTILDASEIKKIETFLSNMPRGSNTCKLNIES